MSRLAADFGYKTFIDMLQALTIYLNYRDITPPQSIDWRERVDIPMRHGGVDRPHISIPQNDIPYISSRRRVAPRLRVASS